MDDVFKHPSVEIYNIMVSHSNNKAWINSCRKYAYDWYRNAKLTLEITKWMLDNDITPNISNTITHNGTVWLNNDDMYEVWILWQKSHISDCIASWIFTHFDKHKLVITEFTTTGQFVQFPKEYDVVFRSESFWNELLSYNTRLYWDNESRLYWDNESILSMDNESRLYWDNESISKQLYRLFSACSSTIPFNTDIANILVNVMNRSNSSDTALILPYIYSIQCTIDDLKRTKDSLATAHLFQELKNASINEDRHTLVQLLIETIKEESCPFSYVWSNVVTHLLEPLSPDFTITDITQCWIQCAAEYIAKSSESIEYINCFKLDTTYKTLKYAPSTIKTHLYIAIYKKFLHCDISNDDIRRQMVTIHKFMTQKQLDDMFHYNDYIISNFFDQLTYWIYFGEKKIHVSFYNYEVIFNKTGLNELYRFWIDYGAPCRIRAYTRHENVDWGNVPLSVSVYSLYDTCVSLVDVDNQCIKQQWMHKFIQYSSIMPFIHMVVYDVYKIAAVQTNCIYSEKHVIPSWNKQHSSNDILFNILNTGEFSNDIMQVVYNLLSPTNYRYIDENIRMLSMLSVFMPRHTFSELVTQHYTVHDSMIHDGIDSMAYHVMSNTSINIVEQRQDDISELYSRLGRLSENLKVQKNDIQFLLDQDCHCEYDNVILREYYDTFAQSLNTYYTGCSVRLSGHVKTTSAPFNTDAFDIVPDILGIKSMVAVTLLPFVALLRIRNTRRVNHFLQIASSITQMEYLSKKIAMHLLRNQCKIRHIQRTLALHKESIIDAIENSISQIKHSLHDTITKKLAHDDAIILVELIMNDDIDISTYRHDIDAMGVFLADELIRHTTLIPENQTSS